MGGRWRVAAVCWAWVPGALRARSIRVREQRPRDTEPLVRGLSLRAAGTGCERSLGHRPEEPLGSGAHRPGPSTDRHHPEKARPGRGTVTMKLTLSATLETCGGRTPTSKERKLHFV